MQTITELERLEKAVAIEVTIRPLKAGEDATPFRALNEEWITRLFKLEPKDIATLGDPEGTILARGGQVYLVWCGGEAVGCVALIPVQDGVYELSKMAVAPRMRGQGVGRRLLEYTIHQARQRGATSLFLGSSRNLASAVHLYESIGFRHVPPESLPEMHYSRANVFMQMTL